MSDRERAEAVLAGVDSAGGGYRETLAAVEAAFLAVRADERARIARQAAAVREEILRRGTRT